MLNPDLERLRPYPFEQLASLFAGLHAPKGLKAISLSIGEPQHSPPQFVLDALTENIDLIAKYPTTRGDRDVAQGHRKLVEPPFLTSTCIH